MKKLCIILAAAVGLTACHHEKHDELSHNHNHGAAGHGSEIVLEPEMAERYGVKVDTVREGAFTEVIVASGIVTEAHGAPAVASAPTAGIVHISKDMLPGRNVAAGTVIATIDASNVSGGNANAAQKAAFEAAQRELDRVTLMYREGVVTSARYNQAVAEYEQAKAAYSPSAAAGSVKTPTAGAITSLLVADGQYVETGAPIANISNSSTVTLRVDVPRRHAAAMSTIDGVKVKTADGVIDYRVKPQIVASTPGYISAYFTLAGDVRLLPGAVVDAYLTGKERHCVITLPVGALSEQQGNYFVYAREDEDCYEKLPVTIGANDGERVEIKSGLEKGELIVVDGTAAVRLAETSAVAPEGHSHNH